VKAFVASKGLAHFKAGMGFTLRPYSEQLAFNPLLKPFLMWKGDAIVSRFAQRYPDNQFWLRASRALRLATGDLPSTLEDEDEEPDHRPTNLQHSDFAEPRA
jgi:hypothetical protein